MTARPPAPVTIRPATAAGAPAVADLYLAVRKHAEPAIPPLVHDDADVRAWFAGPLLATDTVLVAEAAGRVVGFAAYREPDWLDHLYVAPDAAGRGVGSALLAAADEALRGRMQLWTFQSNTAARRFYERRGFVAAEQTAGDNEERAPDVRYVRRRPERASAVTRRSVGAP